MPSAESVGDATGAKYFHELTSVDIDASSETEFNFAVKASSQNWSQFTEHLARFQHHQHPHPRHQQQQQQQQSGSFTELRPVHAEAVSASGLTAASNLAGGDYLHAPSPPVTFPATAYYGGACCGSSYVVTTTSASSPAHAFHTW